MNQYIKKSLAAFMISIAPVGISVVVAAEVSDMKTKYIAGKLYTFKKVMYDNGKIKSNIYDENGKMISASELGNAEKTNSVQKIDPRIRALMNSKPKGLINVSIAFADDVPDPDDSNETGSFDSKSSVFEINKRAISDDERRERINKTSVQRLDRKYKRVQKRIEKLSLWMSKHDLNDTSSIDLAAATDVNTLNLKLTEGQLRKLIDNIDRKLNPDVEYLELTPKTIPNIASAMIYSNVNNRALGRSTTQGNGIGIFISESDGCPNSGSVSNYQKLRGSFNWHGEWVVNIARAVSPGAYIYCIGDGKLPTISELAGTIGHPPVHIINASFKFDNGTNGQYTVNDRDWDDFAYNNDIAIFAAVGNNGNTADPSANSPSLGYNIMAVGNYDEAAARIANDSAYGNPETGAEKPDITTPGSLISAGPWLNSGTSASSPHAASIAADYMQEISGAVYRPYLLRSLMYATASQPETGSPLGGNNSVGAGGMNFLNDQSGFYWNFTYWDGTNSYFNTSPDSKNGVIEKSTYISSSDELVTIAIAWNNRGSYTFAHKTDLITIGQDYDLQIFDPSGNSVGLSQSIENSWERVKFQPTVSGNYKIKISRYANRDTTGRFELGMTVFRN